MISQESLDLTICRFVMGFFFDDLNSEIEALSMRQTACVNGLR